MRNDLLERAKAHLAAGNLRAAGAIAQVYVHEIEPKDGEAQLLQSQINLAVGQLPEAVDMAANALAIAPDNTDYRRHLEGLLGRLALDNKSPPVLARGAGRLLDRMNATGGQAIPEDSSERANVIDFVLPMEQPAGSELNTIETAKRLREKVETRIWSPTPPHQRLLDLDPTIRQIGRDGVPDAEVVAIRSTYIRPGEWMRQIRPQRLILHFNVFRLIDLVGWLGAASQLSIATVDVLFVSQWLKDVVGIDGTVLASAIDLEPFPARAPSDTPTVVGRISRDAPNKHHPQDPPLYRSLLSEGFDVRLLGATSLAPFLPDQHRLTLLPEYSVPAREFLHSLDVFLYRTGVFFEPWGRVVIEAMACGLPVVCHRTGGYAEAIRHGENGFLFETTDEANEIIRTLRDDRTIRKRVGEAARQTALELQSRVAADRLIDYFARL